MVSKEIVVKVIEDFRNAKVEKEEQRNDEADLLKSAQYTPKERALCDFLKRLPKDDLVDLCSLMVCGRKSVEQTITLCSPDSFRREREAFYENHKTDEKLAEYLISKGFLDEYLTSAIAVFDTVQLGF